MGVEAVKINLPMRNLTGPFTMEGTKPDGRKYSDSRETIQDLVMIAVELNLTRWQIKGQQGKRRRILLEDTK